PETSMSQTPRGGPNARLPEGLPESATPNHIVDTIPESQASSPRTLDFALNVADEGKPYKRMGGYELVERLGGGGMGVVFRAYDPDLQREVALKTIREGVFAEKDEVDRFLNEARAVAKLDHPNIISIFEIGQDNGYHFFTMQLACGGPL